MNAYDLGEPSLSSTAQLTVNVVRNSFAPEFTPPQYTQNIDFTTAVDEVVETVTARDRDENVSPQYAGAIKKESIKKRCNGM